MTQISIYLKEIEKESKRNALIRDRKKHKHNDIDECGYSTVTDRKAAHLERRIDRSTRNKWYALSCRLQNTDADQVNMIKNGLEKTREEIRKSRKFKTQMKHGV